MAVCRTNRNAKLAAGLLKGHFVLSPIVDVQEPCHQTAEYQREGRLNERHAELIAQGMDWMTARKQARAEIMNGEGK